MNKATRKSNGDIREPPPHSSRNNINILINFNMKDKAHIIPVKKTQSHTQVETKITNKVETHITNLEHGKKSKKKGRDMAQRLQRQKMFQTPTKQKPAQLNKIIKNIKQEKTPQRNSNSRQHEKSKSKSTNQKLRKKKNARSVQTFKSIKHDKNKSRSQSSSTQKYRSHSKSRKTMIKSQKQSLKKLHVFTNLNIKNSISKSKGNSSKEKQIDNQGREDDQKIKLFMEEKKKRQRIEKEKQIKEQQFKKNKIVNQLRKVEIQRKANASKSFVAPKKTYDEGSQRIPVYFIDEGEFDEQDSYNTLKKQAERMIHDSPPPSYPIDAIQIEKPTSSNKYKQLSSKKDKKSTKRSLVNKYINGTIKQRQLRELNKQMIKIQACWRGYRSRKRTYRKLSDQYTRIRYIKNKVDNKKGGFWNEQQNSIVQIETQLNRQVYSSGNSSNFIVNSVNSNTSSNEISAIQGVKPSNDKYQKLSIELDKRMVQNIQFQGQKNNKLGNVGIMQELQKIKRQLEKQNQKFRSLEMQNQFLKQNIKVLSLKESRVQRINKSTEKIDISQQFQIRMPKKIEESEIVSLSSFRKQFQVFDCSSPTNIQIEQQVKVLKNKNIASMFRKKQLLIEQKYDKKAKMFVKMLHDKILSPRTFETKNAELSNKKQLQKDQIGVRIQEAKRVVDYIGDISLSEPLESEGISKDFHIQQTQKKQLLPIIKKQMVLQDNFTNTTPTQQKAIQFLSDLKKVKVQMNTDNWNNSESSEEQHIYKKYWGEDIEDVHKQTLQITKKIEEAMRNESQSSSAQVESDSSKYNSLSQGYDSLKYRESDVVQRQKSKDEIKSHDEIRQEQILSDPRTQRIFNLNLNEEDECKSEQQDNLSHGEIIHLLNNNGQVIIGNEIQVKKEEKAFISELQFNKKKRKEEQLSRSSSFEKSNRSLSNNGSQVSSKGFITNLTFIKQFCITVCEFIQNHEVYQEKFIMNVSQSIQYDLYEYLKAYRTTIDGQFSSRYNTFQEQYLYPYFRVIANKSQPLTKELFIEFLQYYEQENINNPRWNAQTLTKNTKEWRNFFLISIIDAFNESLEFQKPGSIYGKSLPWLPHSKILKNYKNYQLRTLINPINTTTDSYTENVQEYSDSQMKLDQIFGASIAKLIQWGGFLCGFIADPNTIEMADSQIANLSSSQLNSIRENRVGLMLQKWLVQQQQNMTNSLAEYTEVLLCLGQKIIEVLISECAQELFEVEALHFR